MFFLIIQNIVVGTPVCQYATAEFRCWYTGGPIRGERVKDCSDSPEVSYTRLLMGPYKKKSRGVKIW